MAYLHSAFIENTQEAREWLESLGYELADERDDFEGLQTNPIGFKHLNGTYRTCYYKPILVKKSMYVDCRGNFSLFKSVTALRDDNSLMQWFKSENNEWILNDGNCKEDLDYGVEICVGLFYPYWHKATLEELIEHFRMKTI